MKKLRLLILLWPILCGAQNLLVWDNCQKEQCFWVENSSKMYLKLSFSKDCNDTLDSSQNALQLFSQRFFHFNSRVLYQWTATIILKGKIRALNIKIEDEEHCFPLHCHPSEENCNFKGAYVVHLNRNT